MDDPAPYGLLLYHEFGGFENVLRDVGIHTIPTIRLPTLIDDGGNRFEVYTSGAVSVEHKDAV